MACSTYKMLETIRLFIYIIQLEPWFYQLRNPTLNQVDIELSSGIYYLSASSKHTKTITTQKIIIR